MRNTSETHTVSPELNARIRSNAERAVAKLTAELEVARENGREDHVAAIQFSLDFWTRTAARDHTGRRVGTL